MFRLPNLVSKQWVTIGGHAEGDEEHVGGTAVFIEGGKITRGPAHMIGRAPSELKGSKKKPAATDQPTPSTGKKPSHHRRRAEVEQQARARWTVAPGRRAAASRAMYGPSDEDIERAVAQEVSGHKTDVRMALATGKYVAPEVVADYPDLTKEPHHMTRAEFRDSLVRDFSRASKKVGWEKESETPEARRLQRYDDTKTYLGEKDEHHRAVEGAVSSGKPVSPEVLAAYPDLARHRAAKSFRLPLLTKAGHYDESKHRRERSGPHGGEFTSGGRSTSGHPVGTHVRGSIVVPRKARPPALPARHNPLLESLFAEPVQAKPAAPSSSAAALRSNPLLESIFGANTPKPPLEHDAAYKPHEPLRAPGTGKPPANLGSPKSVDEARDQLIWLLGRATILRRQGREAGRMGPKPAKELTLAINLASRLQHQFFRGQQAAQAQAEKAEKAKKPAGKSS